MGLFEATDTNEELVEVVKALPQVAFDATSLSAGDWFSLEVERPSARISTDVEAGELVKATATEEGVSELRE